jgi:hypothetical protein
MDLAFETWESTTLHLPWITQTLPPGSRRIALALPPILFQILTGFELLP